MTVSNEAIRLTRAQVVALNPCSENHIPDFGRRKSMTASKLWTRARPSPTFCGSPVAWDAKTCAFGSRWRVLKGLRT